jgi:hypothetical protein
MKLLLLLPSLLAAQAVVQQTNCPKTLNPGTIVVAQAVTGLNANYPVIILACYQLDLSDFSITPAVGTGLPTISVTGSAASNPPGSTGNVMINGGGGVFAALATLPETYFNLTDVTTANASRTAHGLMPKIPGTAGYCLDSTTGTWRQQVCGQGGSGGSSSIEVRNEVPSGAVDGINVTFTLANNPIGTSVNVFLNGLKQTPSVDYTLNGNSIVFIYTPQIGDTLNVDYLHN